LKNVSLCSKQDLRALKKSIWGKADGDILEMHLTENNSVRGNEKFILWGFFV